MSLNGQAPRGIRRTGRQGRHHHGLDQAHHLTKKAYQGHRVGHAGLHLVHLHADRYARELAPGDASFSGGAAVVEVFFTCVGAFLLFFF